MERVRHSQDVRFTGNEKIDTSEEEGALGDRLRRSWGEIGEVMEQVLAEEGI